MVYSLQDCAIDFSAVEMSWPYKGEKIGLYAASIHERKPDFYFATSVPPQQEIPALLPLPKKKHQQTT